MTKNELYEIVLTNLVDYLTEKGVITKSDHESVTDHILLSHYAEAGSTLMSYSYPGLLNFKRIIQELIDGLNDTSEIRDTLPVRRHTVSEDNKNRLVPFRYKCSSLAVLTVKKIIDIAKTITVKDFDSTCSQILDLIWYAYKDSEVDLNYIWECFEGKHEDDYFLLTNELDDPIITWRLYSYAYFCFVNEEKFEMPKSLVFNGDRKFAPSIVYESQTKYEQYFDVYNVMSESKYSNDLLSRYLRMYQILEYMTFRKSLAELTKGNIKENGFVRNVISKASKGSANEFSEMKRHLPTLFEESNIKMDPDILPVGDLDLGMRDFINNTLMVNSNNHEDLMWHALYKLRNCIVHNKECELHFMYVNTKAYDNGIKLMQKFVDRLEPLIVRVINDHQNTHLEFDHPTICLY